MSPRGAADDALDVIKAKHATGRWQDLEDIKAVEATAENDKLGG